MVKAKVEFITLTVALLWDFMQSCLLFKNSFRGQGRAAYNMGIAASGAGRWPLRLLFSIRLWLWQEVINLPFCFYLQLLKQNRAAVVGRRFSNIPPAAIPVRYAPP